MSKKSRVAIIGAGVSGLAAGLKLAKQASIDVTIFEARREPGGRTRSHIDSETGDTVDNGQHLLASCYTATLEYLKIIGTDSLLDTAPALDVQYWQAGKQYRLQLPRIPSPTDLVIGLLRTNLLSASEKVAAIRFGDSVRAGKLPLDLEELTVSELLGQYRQPDLVIQKLWEPIVLATINARASQASATLFVNVLQEFFFAKPKGSRLLFPEVGLADLLITPAVSTIGLDRFQFGKAIRSIDGTSELPVLHSDSDSQRFDFVIRTDTTVEADYSPIVNTYLWLDRSVLYAPIVGFLGTTIQWAFPKPTRFSEQLLALTVSAAFELVDQPPETIINQLWHDLQLSVPEATRARVVRSKVIKEKRATPLLTPEANRQRPHIHGESRRVFLAGDYVQNGLPATIEGAVRNGFAAAEMVLREAAMH